MGINNHGNGTGVSLGANLAFTKFLFVLNQQDDDAAGTRLRAVGSLIGRGFFNDFDSDGTRDTQPFETIQFMVRAGDPAQPGGGADRVLAAARYVAQVSGKYRPRLQEVENELRRRLGDTAEVVAVDGAVRAPRYSSAEMQQYMGATTPPRRSGRVTPHAFIMPTRKSSAWWAIPALERQTYFYPHVSRASGCPVKGHAMAGDEGLAHLHRRIYYNPDGYERPGEYDFVTYFECEEAGVPVFDRACDAVRDPAQNPEWAFVEEGPVWRGTRVLRW